VGRYIAGAMIPFFVLYVDGAAFLFKPFAPVAGPLVFAALTVITMTVSEIALSAHVFSNHFNWFHLLR